MMASRKAVLDKNKQQLLDSVNASNKIYTNEELSILLAEQNAAIELLQSQVTDLKNKNSSLETTIDSLTKADEGIRYHTSFTSGEKNYIVLKFENNTRGSILIGGSSNGTEVLSNILYESFNYKFRTAINNKGAGAVTVTSFSCTATICTMQVNFPNFWGYYFAISSAKFIS